jgi:hypothetical protein
MEEPTVPESNDEAQLRLLSLLHKIYGALIVLLVLATVPFMLTLTSSSNALYGNIEKADHSAGFGFDGLAFMFWLTLGSLALGLAIGILNVLAGFAFKHRRNRILIIITDAINLLNVPLGLALGLFGLIVISRPTVAALFSGPKGG